MSYGEDVPTEEKRGRILARSGPAPPPVAQPIVGFAASYCAVIVTVPSVVVEPPDVAWTAT